MLFSPEGGIELSPIQNVRLLHCFPSAAMFYVISVYVFPNFNLVYLINAVLIYMYIKVCEMETQMTKAKV